VPGIQELGWIGVEGFPTKRSAEVVDRAFVVNRVQRGDGVDVHAADQIFCHATAVRNHLLISYLSYTVHDFTQFAFDPSIEARYRSPSISVTTTGNEMMRPLRHPRMSSTAARLGKIPAAKAMAEARFCSRAKP
jgi:hypothetical protein